jgi:CDP-glycerol glycerophosphotransferase (TagB/SpsB family)
MKNLVIKNMLKGSIFPFISFINKLIPKNDNKVLLHIANKRFVYSLGPLKQYLIENGFDKKYKISYGYQDLEGFGDGKWVEKLAMIKSILRFMTSAHVFYTSGQIPIKPSKSQTVIHLCHGNPHFKPVGKLANIDNGDEFFFTYMLATSELYIPIEAREYECPESCIKVCGDPMADVMLKAPQGIYDFGSYDKLLVWAPTFRNSELMGYNDSNLNTLVPLFDVTDYPELNDLLAKHNIKLIVKLHPIQTVPAGMQRHFSHLSVYSHDEFVASAYDMYTLIANADGLIGDYSTVSMQYLLMDRPQAYVVPDIDDYKGNRGFVFDNPEDYMGGHIVKTKADFVNFIDDFANGKDVYRDKRHWVTDQVYKYKDANSCKRAVELSGMSI